jgi:flagellar hook-length control protein FliK
LPTDDPSLQTLVAAASPASTPNLPPALDTEVTREVGSRGGETLPEGGNDLPLPAVEDVLAALAWPAPAPAVTAPANEARPALLDAGAMSPDLARRLEARGEMASPAPAPAGTGVRPDPSATPLSPAAAAASGPLPEAEAASGAAESLASDSDAAPDLTVDSTASPKPELAMPDDFRARLESILTIAQRPAMVADGGAPPLTAGITGPATATPAPAAGSAVPAAEIFEAMPTLESLEGRDAWSRGLGERLLVMAERGMQSATLRLQPEHLGPMEIRIRVDGDGAAQVLFSAHHPQTREALESAIPRLRELFADQGLSLMQANVDSGRSPFAQRDFSSPLPWRTWQGDDPEMTALTDASVWRVSRNSERRLDVFV